MYNQTAVLGTTFTAGMLPFTGFNVVWFVLAGFALLATGTALLRLVPRRQA